MATLLSESDIWREIDASESFLACHMYEDAASLSTSIIQQLCILNTTVNDENQLGEMKESAAMVLVQSLKELGRTSDLFIELKRLFGSVAMVPIQVFVASVCLQISERNVTYVSPILEEFLDEWKYMNNEVYVLAKAQSCKSSETCMLQSVISVEEYVEVAEVYAITVLGMLLHSPGIAMSWIERAEIPDLKRQEIIGKLRPMVDMTAVVSASGTDSTFRGDHSRRTDPDRDKPDSNALRSAHPSTKLTPAHTYPSFWLLRVVNKRLRNVLFANPRGKLMLLGPLVFFMLYILQRRRATFKRFLSRQASSIWKALIDAWQLAFSVQVNPLAAVQPISSAAHGNR